MNKCKKLLCGIMAGIMAFSLFGCMYQTTDVTFDDRGGGTIKAEVGYTMDIIEAMGGSESDLKDNGFTAKRVDGETYYTTTFEMSFDDVEKAAEGSIDVDNVGADAEYEMKQAAQSVKTSFLQWVEFCDNGGYHIDITNGELTDATKADIDAATAADMTGKDMEEINEALSEGMVLTLSMSFPYDIDTIEGGAGITADGKKLTIDFTKATGDRYEYWAGPEGTKYEPDPMKKYESVLVDGKPFNDVDKSHWWFEAVCAAKLSGIFKGNSDGSFNPTGEITVEEFATVMSRIAKLDTTKHEGTLNKRWSQPAIDACVEAGFLPESLQNAKWTVKVPREMAIALIQKVTKAPAIEGNDFKASDIPDWKEISAEYQALILEAFNSGLTTGAGGNKVLPKDTLTRAEVCQLLRNISLI